MDAVNNLLAFVVVRVAAGAPDEEHPYRHATFETLCSAVAQRLMQDLQRHDVMVHIEPC